MDKKIAYALSLYPSNPEIAEFIIAYCIVKLHDQWNARCRELIVKSALGQYRTSSGVLLPRAIRMNPLHYLRKQWSPKKIMHPSWEPKWHSPYDSIRAARLLDIVNYDTVANALSAITLMDSFRNTRNAIVHELPNTYKMFRSIQRIVFNPPTFSPVEYAIQRIPDKSDLIIDAWMNELQLALRAATK